MQVRWARQTTRLDAVVAFYRDGLGLPEIDRFTDHDGYSGVMLDLPGTGAHLEFTSTTHVAAPTPHPETLLVLYLGDRAEVDRLVAHAKATVVPSLNPYWDRTGVTVVDPRWVKPIDPALVPLAEEHRLVVSIEDNGRVGGFGANLLQLLNDENVAVPFRLHGIPQEFLDHAKREAILERIGLTAQALARKIVEDVTALDAGHSLVDAP